MVAGKIVLIFLVLVIIFSSGCIQASRPPNESFCENVSMQQNIDACYYNVALAKGEGALCSKIQNLDTKDHCYIDMAAGRSNYAD